MKYYNSTQIVLGNLSITDFDNKKWLDVQGYDGNSIVPFRIKTTTLKMCYRDAFSFYTGIPSVKIEESYRNRDVRLFNNMIDFLNNHIGFTFTMIVYAGRLVCIGFGTRKSDLLSFSEKHSLTESLEYNDCSFYFPHMKHDYFSIGVGQLITCKQKSVIVLNCNTEVSGTCVRFIPYYNYTYSDLELGVNTFIKNNFSLNSKIQRIAYQLLKELPKTFCHLDNILKDKY